MGLDQFAYSLPTDNARSEVDFDIDAVPKNERKQIHHWRATDSITMPDRHRFVGTKTSTATEGWYSTLLYELTHWSGAEARCARTFGERFGDDAYAMEEMVAELGAAFLCGDLGITAEPRADHADYIGHWLRILKGDRKAIFTAASAANKAAEYLKSIAQIEHREAA
ncbi:MAG: zincin-like metallopeptidase domain-containing protein [Myxococcota bacterium]|jgi:antirestriction protein ArdC